MVWYKKFMLDALAALSVDIRLLFQAKVQKCHSQALMCAHIYNLRLYRASVSALPRLRPRARVCNIIACASCVVCLVRAVPKGTACVGGRLPVVSASRRSLSAAPACRSGSDAGQGQTTGWNVTLELQQEGDVDRRK